jgi:hypothetical protein
MKTLLGIAICYKDRDKFRIVNGDIFPPDEIDEVREFAKDEAQKLKKKTFVKKVFWSFENV